MSARERWQSPDGFAQPMSARERFAELRPQVAAIERGLCPRCGRKWHPPALCWAYGWLSEDDIETIAANILNNVFEAIPTESEIAARESEGGR